MKIYRKLSLKVTQMRKASWSAPGLVLVLLSFCLLIVLGIELSGLTNKDNKIVFRHSKSIEASIKMASLNQNLNSTQSSIKNKSDNEDICASETNLKANELVIYLSRKSKEQQLDNMYELLVNAAWNQNDVENDLIFCQ